MIGTVIFVWFTFYVSCCWLLTVTFLSNDDVIYIISCHKTHETSCHKRHMKNKDTDSPPFFLYCQLKKLDYVDTFLEICKNSDMTDFLFI